MALQGRRILWTTLAAVGPYTHLSRLARPPCLQRAEASLPRVRDLNPLVQTTAVTKDASQLSDEELRTFSCVVLCDAPLPTQVSVAERCHALRVPVIAATLMGFWGFFFEDVGEHSYRTEDVANTGDGEAAKPATLGSVQHKALSAAMATPWRDLSLLKVKPAAFAYMALLHGARAGEVGPSSTPAEVAAVMARHAAALCPPPAPLPPPSVQGRRSNKTVVDMSDLAGADGCSGVLHSMAAGYGRELSAVATVLGGCIGNEVVKILTGKEEPVTNLYTFDAMQGTGGYASTF